MNTKFQKYILKFFTSPVYQVNIYDGDTKQNMIALVFDRALNFRFVNRFIKSNIIYVLNIRHLSFKSGRSSRVKDVSHRSL